MKKQKKRKARKLWVVNWISPMSNRNVSTVFNNKLSATNFAGKDSEIVECQEILPRRKK